LYSIYAVIIFSFILGVAIEDQTNIKFQIPSTHYNIQNALNIDFFAINIFTIVTFLLWNTISAIFINNKGLKINNKINFNDEIILSLLIILIGFSYYSKLINYNGGGKKR
jgi:pilus assembly protein TadC